MMLTVEPARTPAHRGHIAVGGRVLACAIGRNGVRADKREGDGCTPVGAFPLRRVMYRADRLAAPRTRLPLTIIRPDDGWCDAPDDAAYNRPVTLPNASRAERLWREDRLYDVIVIVGHNDDPVVPGAGSAIFLHVAADGYGPTEGCVTLALPDLLDVLADCGPDSRLNVQSAAV
ncbi:MAG: L,D-transpeptidase family protein [Rhodospirillaceae bacterium]|nr:L,D-transpeptidase family protein [Rhodospirillaceae bacterium]